jgi:hypothetical protein
MERHDTITVNGLDFAVYLEQDESAGAPWTDEDGHGPVRIGSRHADGVTDKRPGERPLNQAGRRETQFFYDWQEAMRIAKRDEWDAPPYKTGTKGEQAARAVLADFNHLSGFVNGDWVYVGVRVVRLDGDGEETDESDSLWGVESGGDYWHEVAEELADGIAQTYWAAQGEAA